VRVATLARTSLDRLARYEIRPNRELGQNFLVDDNVLAVIGRTAELDADDVVLEIGGGLGVLSEYLAQRVARVEVIESDRRLEPVLREALARFGNVDLVLADVMDINMHDLRAPPSKVVSNLPYGVAVPALVRTITELPSIALWCIMVQREIAERLASPPGRKTYGVPSVIVQLACAVKLVRPISRNVFHPVPKVDSALVRLRRIAPAPSPAVHALVRAAFAHRRKALPRSLELALRGGRELREAARSALAAIDHPEDERAERLAPQEFAALAQRLERWL
jgi:16S rRNA (adenine1518-N6/adenine1519-N6)-dimethyltransferase